MTGVASAFVSRLERFDRVGSTQAIVRDWLDAGVDEVCVAVADEQTAGRGRLERDWLAAPGRALLVSAGFRPPALPAQHGWRLSAIASVAMLGAATSLLGPTADRLALKWPNDIIAIHRGRLRKVAGVLSEGSIEGEHLVSAVVGIGINVDWPASNYPADLAASMWSLSEASGRRRIDRDGLLDAWLERLGPLYHALCAGSFDGLRWADAQIDHRCCGRGGDCGGQHHRHRRGHRSREWLIACAYRCRPAAGCHLRGRRGALFGARRG